MRRSSGEGSAGRFEGAALDGAPIISFASFCSPIPSGIVDGRSDVGVLPASSLPHVATRSGANTVRAAPGTGECL
ncbi:hypothetical protein DB32_001832 [Sandaracinus amylolyticus]|uniref:Uncharacterized protein n=1 Tax=Sandaracinus amylolyticus TaxID=927083 RepID=A0A0F6W174_9BACT|nr:hypothetical protein DB32_001832 [Sandaracinus amylolyticus]